MMVKPWLGAVLLAMTLVGCAMLDPRSTPEPEPAPTLHPLVMQAAELARANATAGNAARAANRNRIQALLVQLDDVTLAQQAALLPPGDPLYNHVGRALLRRGLPLPHPFDRVAWHFGDGTRPPAAPDGYRPPTTMAVLLPMTGRLAAAAAPVRDGFLAAYYGEQRRRPQVNFYDTHSTAGGTLAAYAQAVAEGNQLVVGPLGRTAVSAVFNRASLPVSVLALNHGSVPPPPGHASFSLSPEDEGVAAAELLLQLGAQQVLVIAGSDNRHQRAVAALRGRLEARGAVVGDVVGAAVTDLAPFTAQGKVDGVFLAVDGNTARELMPKLALAGLVGKPLVGTSKLLTGTGDPAKDRVLDGIVFPTVAWTSGRFVRGLPTADHVARNLPTARGGAARLFAFGYDAWLLAAYLEHLALDADARVAGATGTLRIDGFGKVQRIPAWSTFRAGSVVPFDLAP